MEQLRQRHLTFDSHCSRHEYQPIKHLVLWDGQAGKMFRGQDDCFTYVKQLQHDSCYETVEELQWKMKNLDEWHEYHAQVPDDWKILADGWMNGRIRQSLVMKHQKVHIKLTYHLTTLLA